MPDDLLSHLDETIIPKTEIAAGKLFVSYSRRNRDFATALYEKLNRMGFTLWRDVHDIEAGADDWWESIKEAIRESETVILCMSLPALKSPVVSDEWLYARSQGKRIIPVVVDEIWGHPEVKTDDPAKRFTIPNWMTRKNWLDFRPSVPEASAAWANLIRTLNETYVGKRFINMVEELPPRFVRRPEDMDKAIVALVKDNRDAVPMTTALNVAGGYGKTTLAKAIARDLRVQGAFDDGILWVTLGEDLLTLSGQALHGELIRRIRELITELTGQKTDFETLEMAQASLKQAIGDLYILMVIDDVWDESHLRPFLVKTPHSSCLITTRNLNTVNRDDIKKQTVDRMKPIEAAELLGAGLDPDEVKSNDAKLKAFARGLREYPLVLALANTQIVNYMHDMGIPLREALDLAQAVYDEGGIFGFDETDTDERTRAVSKTLELSINQLTPVDRQQMYRELAIFPDDALIPLSVLESYWGLSKVQTLQFCQTLYRKTALLHSFEGYAIRVHDVFRECLIRYWTPEERVTLQKRLTDRLGWKPGAAFPETNTPYLWRNLAYHLIEGKQSDYLRTLLLNARYLFVKLRNTDPNALIADATALLKQVKDEPIRLVESAVRMSAHVLRDDATALGHQLVGRLMLHRKAYLDIRTLTDGLPDVLPGLYPLDFNSADATHNPAGAGLLATLAGHTGGVQNALILADGRFLSWAGALSTDNTLRLWAGNGTPMAVLAGHTLGLGGAMALTDGRFLSWSWDNTLRLWASDGMPLAVLTGHTHPVSGVVPLSNKHFLSWSWDNTLRLWANDGTPLAVLTGHENSVNGALALDDGRFLSWSGDETLRLWAADGMPVTVLAGHAGWVSEALVLRDGRFLSWCGGNGSNDYSLRLWTNNGSPLTVLTGHTADIKGVLVLSNGRFLSWSDDQSLRLWTNDGSLFAILTGHTERVEGALALSDGRFLSWSEDHTLRLWADDGTPLAVLTGHTNVWRECRYCQMVDFYRGVTIIRCGCGRTMVHHYLLLKAIPHMYLARLYWRMSGFFRGAKTTPCVCGRTMAHPYLFLKATLHV